MVKILNKNKTIAVVKNYDTALRTCAKIHIQDHTPINDLTIIGNRGDQLPVNIKHLI